jgi:hypothetical protein
LVTCVSFGIDEGRVQDFVADDTRHVPTELHRLDVLGTRAFLALSFRVRHFLAFMEIVETATLDARRVEEEVFFLPGEENGAGPIK